MVQMGETAVELATRQDQLAVVEFLQPLVRMHAAASAQLGLHSLAVCDAVAATHHRIG